MSGVFPDQGPYGGGTEVTIVGRHLGGATAVHFGTRPAANVTVVDDQTLLAVTPAGSGAVRVSVTTPGGSAVVGTFFYLRAPLLSHLVPAAGPLAGGNAVVVSGTNLFRAVSVHFGDWAAFPTVLSDQQLLVTAPAAAVPGTVPVFAVAVGGVSNRLPYLYAGAPAIVGVSPAGGPVAGGTTVVIRGTGLGRTEGVTFAGQAATSVRAFSDTLVVAVVPAGVAGPADVTVTTPGGTDTFPGSFIYMADSSTALTSAPDPSVSGQSVTFTAAVTGSAGAGTPTGTVEFDFGDGAPTVTAPLVGGTATISHTYADPVGGPFTTTATYSGDTRFYPSTATGSHSVAQAATTTTVTATPDPSVTGQSIAFVARVAPDAPGAGVPTGTVTFDFGDGQPPVSVPVSGGTAVAEHTYSAAGPYPVSVSYSGDLAFAPSTGTDGHLAEPAASSTRLSVSPEPSAVGQAVAFTATVAAVPPGSGTPTGTVTFDFGDGTPPQEALLTTGAATTTHTFVSTADGPRTITATYSGDADFTASADQDTHTVEPAATTTVITSAPDPAAVGEQVAFTATVAAVPPGSGTPTGSVTFDFGDATDPVTVPLTGGTADATHAYPRTAAQPYPVTAVYQGTADFTPSSATATQTVTAAATTTAITSAPDPAAVGEQVAFTATVAAVPPGSGTPTGTVTFDFGDGTTAAATLTDGTATTVHTYTETAAEPYPVSAAYTGTADFAPSTGTATQSVTAAATTTAITSAPEPAVTGRESTFLAYVTAATPAAPPPTGTVTFDFGDGSPPQTVPVNGGVAEATHTNPAAGTAYTVTADYNGDADFSPSAAARTHAVTQAGTATTVSADPYPSVPGEQVTFTATVAADPPGARTPQGAVTFDFGDGSPPVAAPLTGGTATTTHTYPTAAGSPYTVTASYGADTDFLASTGTLTHTVDHAPTTTTVTADPQPSVTGAPVTVTATVTSTAPNTPTGTVTFDFGDGTAHLTALLQDGTATVVHAYPAGTADAGPLTITATYDGDENLAPSQGSTPHTVAPAPTTTSVTASAAPSAVGQTVTVFARVVALEPATGAPAGTVTFDFGDGTTPSTAPVTDGVATVTHAYTGTAGSPYTITATYDGSPDFAASSGTWAQQVDADVSTTSTTVTATPQPSPAGQAVTFTATVEVLPPAAGTATGTVTFDFGDGSPPVAAPLTGGTATTTHTYPSAAGSPYTVTARYSGDADFAGSAQITTQLVEPSASSTTLETAPAPSLSGQPVTLTATVTAAGPGTGTPTGTVTFDFGDGTPTQTAALSAGTATVLHAFSSSGSPYPLTATYHGDPDFLGSTASGTQTVTPAPTVTSVNAPGPSLTGQTVTFTATVTAPTAGAGTPAGSVTFDFGDATSPVTVPILAGVAVVPHTYATTAGSPYTVTAAYDGDADHTASTGTLPHTVHAAPTTTTVTLTPQPTTPGRPVTVTATVAPVAPGGGVPTGTVTFTFGADDPPITVPLDGSAATISHTDATPSLAPHTFTATYNGSADHTTSIGTATHTTVPDTTTTTVSADTAPTTVGQAVTFTATIAPTQPGALDPTGSVTFDFGDATGPVSAPVLAGTAVVSHTYATTAGSPYTVTAAYSGDTYATASTGTTTHTVQPAPTTLEIQSTSQTPVAGQPITVTAAVTPATPTTAAPTGTVTFDFGDGSPSVPVPLQAGTAAVAHTYPHASGTPYQITATYSGDTDFAPADGVHSQSVGRAATATATAVSTTPNPSPAGRPVTVTASVTPVAPATGTPTGTVTFDFADGGEPVTAVLTDGAATITHTYPHTAGSPFTLTATYSGDGDFTASSGTRTQSVARIPTATQVSDEPDPALTGQPVTVTATVATVPPGAATPTGTVTFDFGDHTDPQTVPLVAGTATAPHAYTASSGAQSTITATYSGDTDAEPSVGTTPHTTLRGVTTTMIDCSSDPSAAGQPITVTASVTAVPPSTGQPEGTVTFDPGDGTGPVTVELVGAIATYTHSYLHASPTPHQITAAYSGNADFRPSAGDHTHQVAPAATLTTISPPPEPTPVGQPATITATVTAAAPGSGTPTGTVTLDFGDGEPPVSALLVNGTVSLTHTYPHTAGTPFTVTATYGGDADFTSSTGAATTAVTPAATTTTLLTTPNPATPGTPVTVIARTTAATPQAGPPSGTVTIDFGDATPPVTVPLTGGVATATHTYDATASPYTLTASYGGDADFTASTATTTQTVTADTVLTTTTVTSSPQPSVTGQTVSFTATVTPVDSGGVPTGTVTFDFGDGQSPVTATLAGATVTVPYTYPHTTGSPYTVTATYAGGGDFASSTGTGSQSVVAAATTTTVAGSPDPAAVGQPVTFTAIVTPTAPGAGTPTGTVTFDFGDSTTLSAALVNGIATTTHTYPHTAGTPFTVTAAYAGGGDFASSTGTGSQSVVAAATTTTVAGSPDPAAVGQPVTFTAIVTPTAPGAGTPTGTVTFTFGDGTEAVTAPLTGGQATTTHTYTSRAGTPYTVTAAYGGDTDFTASTATGTQRVSRSDTATTISSSPAPSTAGEQTTLTATVTPTAPGAGTPTGTVTFTFGDGTEAVTAPLTGGQATTTHTYTTARTAPYTVTATYDGDLDFRTSTASGTHAVGRAASVTTVAGVPDPSVAGQSVAFSATVASAVPGGPVPTGTVTFSFGDGTPDATVPLTGGIATTGHVYASAGGPYTVTAAYNGDTNHTGSQASGAHTVGRAASVTTVAGVPDPSVAGQSAVFSATVASAVPGGPVPTGTVTFSFGDGTPDATVPLTGGIATTGHVYASAGGPYTVTAAYNGDTNHTGSQASGAHTVGRAASVTTVAGVPDPSVAGQSAVFSATVASAVPGGPVPTGTVTFSFGDGTPDATAPLTAGVATTGHAYATRLGSPFLVTAAYNGSPHHQPSTATDRHTVGQTATTTAVTTTPDPSATGQTVTATATVTPQTTGTAPPTGTMTFTFGDGGPAVTATLTAGAATATHTYTTAIPAPYTVTASYGGDTDHAASQAVDGHTVTRQATTTTVTSTPNPSSPGTKVTVTATVTATPPSTGTPTGTIVLVLGDRNPQVVPLIGGVATASFNPVRPGPHTLTASYSGSATSAPSTGTGTHTVT